MRTVEAVALVVRHPTDPDRVLTVLRPGDDPELPNIWGLPAASRRPGEALQATVERLGRAKLGVRLVLGRLLAEGGQRRPDYILKMRLYEAALAAGDPALPAPGQGNDGSTYYTGWRWASHSALRQGADHGSLCCQLFLGWRQADKVAS